MGKLVDSSIFNDIEREEIFNRWDGLCSNCCCEIDKDSMVILCEDDEKDPKVDNCVGLCEKCSEFSYDGSEITDFYRYLGFNSLEITEGYISNTLEMGKVNYNNWLKDESIVFEADVLDDEGNSVKEEVTFRRATYNDLDSIFRFHMNDLLNSKKVKVKEDKLEVIVMKNVRFIFFCGCFYVSHNSKGELVGVFSVHLSKEFAGVKPLPTIKNIACDVKYIPALVGCMSSVIKCIRSITTAIGLCVVVLVRRDKPELNEVVGGVFNTKGKHVPEHPDTNVYACMFSNTKSYEVGRIGRGAVIKMLKTQAKSYEKMTEQLNSDLDEYVPKPIVKDFRKVK